MMARETLEANTFIQQAADKVADSYQTLSQNVADVREDTKPLNDLLPRIGKTPVKDQIKQRHTKDYGERLDNLSKRWILIISKPLRMKNNVMNKR